MLDHFFNIESRYREFCETNSIPVLEPGLHLFGFREWSENCDELLADLTIKYPDSHVAPQLAIYQTESHLTRCDQQPAQHEEL